jgi:cbb3-type cytochrome oxidase subunit 3
MGIINYLFVNIYGQTQRLDNMNRGKIDSVLWSSICIGFCLCVWYSLLIRIYYYVIFKSSPPPLLYNKSVTILLIILLTGIINWYYNRNNRAFKLYQKYIKLNNKVWSIRKTFLVLMTVFFIPFILIFIIDFVLLK